MTRKLTPWLFAALAVEVGLVVLNATAGSSLVPTAAYIVPPLALALVGPPRSVAIVGAVAAVAVVWSGFPNDNFASFDHIVRIFIAALGVTLATLSAQARTQLMDS